MDINLIKTDQVCSNSFLIDEKLCLSDSFDIINYNFNSLSAAIDHLTVYANQMNNLYNLFAANSASWNTGSVNTNENTHLYDSMYVNVTQLSSTYNKEFAVFYPSMIEIYDWYANITDYENDIKDWLGLNFPTTDFAENQFVNVYINLYQTDTFTFSFSGQYNERCIVMAPQAGVCCSGGSCAEFHHGCNFTHNGRKQCGNAYITCGQSITDSCVKGGCPSLNAKLLKLYNVSAEFNDTFTARCLYLRFQKIGNFTESWTII